MTRKNIGKKPKDIQAFKQSGILELIEELAGRLSNHPEISEHMGTDGEYADLVFAFDADGWNAFLVDASQEIRNKYDSRLLRNNPFRANYSPVQFAKMKKKNDYLIHYYMIISDNDGDILGTVGYEEYSVYPELDEAAEKAKLYIASNSGVDKSDIHIAKMLWTELYDADGVKEKELV